LKEEIVENGTVENGMVDNEVVKVEKQENKVGPITGNPID